MDTNVTAAGSSVSPELAIISPVLRSLMISHTFLTLLIPLSLLLLHYSTPHTRRQPIFILNVVTLLAAFSLGTIVDAIGISTILMPLVPLPPTVYVAIGAIGTFQSMLADLVLLMRLIVVHPLGQIGPRRFALVTFLPILLKVARVINISIFLKYASDTLENVISGTNNYGPYFTSLYLKVEWGAQIVDNSYATIMFIRSIRSREPISECFGKRFITTQSTFAYRLRTLLRIALSNFVIPTLFSIALLVVSFYDVNGDYIGDIIYVNCMISTFGVVFATVWVGKEGRRIAKEQKQSMNLESYHMNRSTSSAPGVGTANLAIGPPSFFTNVVAMVDAGHLDLRDVEQGKNLLNGRLRVSDCSDLEARHKIAFTEQEG